MELSITCSLKKANNLGTFNAQEQKTIAAAHHALNGAHAPYSNFKVGAAICFEDGQTAIGNNQENPAYPSGLCAERVTLFHAMASNSDRKIKVLAIATRNTDNVSHGFAPPCGACLQVIADVEDRQKSPIRIILCGENEYFIAEGVQQFLPFRFELIKPTK